mmetsp:Transcript_108024/g.344923  ORF Transcript_108024/g.344923 Transcript_108024/m.344923 type:complete len:203 (-) Transcript_108024:1259-1867(-)
MPEAREGVSQLQCLGQPLALSPIRAQLLRRRPIRIDRLLRELLRTRVRRRARRPGAQQQVRRPRGLRRMRALQRLRLRRRGNRLGEGIQVPLRCRRALPEQENRRLAGPRLRLRRCRRRGRPHVRPLRCPRWGAVVVGQEPGRRRPEPIGGGGHRRGVAGAHGVLEAPAGRNAPVPFLAFFFRTLGETQRPLHPIPPVLADV